MSYNPYTGDFKPKSDNKLKIIAIISIIAAIGVGAIVFLRSSFFGNLIGKNKEETTTVNVVEGEPRTSYGTEGTTASYTETEGTMSGSLYVPHSAPMLDYRSPKFF